MLWHFLRLLECKRMIISDLKVGVLEQGNLQKVVSNGWCKESRIVMHANSKRFIHTLPTDKFFDLE